jgi:ankyrin repeat protein
VNVAIFGQIDHEQMAFQREWHDWSRSENTASMAMALEEGQDINEIVLDGHTASSIAALEGKLRLFDFLREHNADFQKLDGNDMNTLMCSAYAGTVKVAAKILSRGEPQKHLSTTNSKQQTPLHFAALSGRAEMSQYLISKGADISAKDIDGNTPLHFSMKGGSPLTVKILLGAGASTEEENAKGQTPSKFTGGHAACKKAIEEGSSAHGGMSFGGMSAP